MEPKVIVTCSGCGKRNRVGALGGKKAVCGNCRKGIEFHAPLELDDASFAWLESVPAAVVDFWAPWCGPCRQFAPLFERSASENRRVIHAKLNVDQNPHTAGAFRVSSIPTLVLLRQGKEVDRIVGAVPASTLQQALASLAGS